MTMLGAKSRRDRMAIAIVVVVFLYAFAAFLWFTGRSQAWEIARKRYEKVRETLMREKALIADRALWEERAEEARQRMPHVDADERIEKTAARWERVIERLYELFSVLRDTYPDAGAQIYRLYNKRISDNFLCIIDQSVHFSVVRKRIYYCVKHRHARFLQHGLCDVLVHADGG